MKQVALITGASAGLGVEFARQLSRRGLALVLAARRKDRIEALANELGNARAVAIDLSNAGANAPVVLTIPATRVTPPMVSRLGEILSHHKGDSEVRIKLQGPTKTTVLRLDRHRVKPDPALFGDLKVLLGPSCLAG